MEPSPTDYAPPGALRTGETESDEMQHMWQFLDSSLATPNGVPPDPTVATNPTSNHQHLHPATAANEELREPMLNDDENGMYNELGDVFSMFFNIDSDDPAQQTASFAPGSSTGNGGNAGGVGVSSGVGNPPLSNNPTAAPSRGYADNTVIGTNVAAENANAKVQLPRSASSSSNNLDSISPGGLLGFPSMSPATVTWLQSLGKSPSSESLSGLISPAALYGSITPSAIAGSAGGASSTGLVDGASGLPRTPSCEMIDWKAYNEAQGIAEKTQKDPPKWRVIPQHGPHADPMAAAASNNAAVSSGNPQTGAFAKPPPASAPSHLNSSSQRMDNAQGDDGGIRNHFTRQFQTIKSTVVSLVGALSAPEVNGSSPAMATSSSSSSFGASGGAPQSISTQEQIELAAKKLAEEKNKRKAIISPEYVQYGSNVSAVPLANGAYVGALDPDLVKVETEHHIQGQFATQVPDPTGRRPSKKTLHRTTISNQIAMPTVQEQQQQQYMANMGGYSSDDMLSGSAVRCKCTGKCRNARCACVKAGFVCGVHCKCVSCANPFVPMEKEGINIRKMVEDICLMQYLSKVKDMQELLDSTVMYECCDGVVQVKKTIENGFTCPTCQTHYTYSWCNNRLCHDQKKPRKHCAKCRRCGDHRNEHCDDCNHCYFAGVANSFSCSCKASNKSSGSGIKARAVVPNINRESESVTMKNESQAASIRPDGASTSQHDENSKLENQQSAQTATMAAGLASGEGEKEDSCPVQ